MMAEMLNWGPPGLFRTAIPGVGAAASEERKIRTCGIFLGDHNITRH